MTTAAHGARLRLLLPALSSAQRSRHGAAAETSAWSRSALSQCQQPQISLHSNRSIRALRSGVPESDPDTRNPINLDHEADFLQLLPHQVISNFWGDIIWSAHIEETELVSLCLAVQKGQEYYLFYSGGDVDCMCGVRIAKSGDPLGRPGSWYKWWEGEHCRLHHL